MPGTYILLAAVREHGSVAARGPGAKALLGTSRVVEIGASDVTGLDLAPRPLPETRGVVSIAVGCALVPVNARVVSSLGA